MFDIFEMYREYLVIIFNKKVKFYCASPNCFERWPWWDLLNFVWLTYVIHEMWSISGYMCHCHCIKPITHRGCCAGVCASKGKIIIIISFLGLFGLVLGFKPFGGLTFLVSPWFPTILPSGPFCHNSSSCPWCKNNRQTDWQTVSVSGKELRLTVK